MLVSGLCFLCASAIAQTPCEGIQLGAFGKSVTYVVAVREGFFAKEGVNVCYTQVAGSVQQFDDLLSGKYDLVSTAADNVINRVANQKSPLAIIAGLDRSPGLVLAGNTANGIRTIADLKGKAIEVDAPDSGFVFALRHILKVNGLALENGDYSLRVIGGGTQRFQVLSAGSVVPSGGGSPQPSYATMLNPPFTQRIAVERNLIILARFSDYVAPYQSGVLTATTSYIETHKDTLYAFLRAMIGAGFFARAPENRERVTASLVAELGLSTDVATGVLDDARNPIYGEVPIALLSRTGMANAIRLRQEFGGLADPNLDGNVLSLPGNGLYDDRIWLAAVDSLFNGTPPTW